MTLLRKGGVVHAMAECTVCGKTWGNYHNAQALAVKHTRHTGHETQVEVGLEFTYIVKDEPNSECL